MASRRATPDRARARPYVRLRVRTNSGVEVPIDQQSARQIEAQKDQTIAKLEQELRTNQYQPQAVKRKRLSKKGRGRGNDNQRWPNAFFTTVGLYSLKRMFP